VVAELLVTASTNLAHMVERYPATLRVLERLGLSCSACVGLEGETVAQAARRHGITVAELLLALNQAAAGLIQE
jgi:hybrid cluster-associated redox disulfide protein